MKLTFKIENLSRRSALSVVGLFALFAGLAGIGLPPLDRDEARFAQATAQMIESGDFISINFQAEERNKKPAGVHWLQAASVAAFSSADAREIWAYRLPSLLAAIIAALGTYLIGARLFDRATGLVAAIALSATPVFIAEATIAKTDAALLAFVVVAQYALAAILADAHENRPTRSRMSVLFWLAIGGGILVKGPIAPLIVGLTLTVLILTHGKLPWRRMMKPLVGVAILVLMITPWAMAIGYATEGRFFSDALGGDMFGKVGAAQESHGGPPGYHLAFALLLLWPIIAVLPAALKSAWEQRKTSNVIFLFAWLTPSWIIFELTATKLPHYTLPLYPAIALIAARYIWSLREKSGDSKFHRELIRMSTLAYGVVSLLFALGVAALPVALEAKPAATLTSLLALLIGLGGLGATTLFWRRRYISGAIAASILSAVTMWVAGAVVLPGLVSLHLSPRLAHLVEGAELSEIRNDAPPVILSGYNEPSAVFLLGTRTRLLAGDDAAREAAMQIGGAIAIESREANAFRAALDASAVRLIEVGKVDGLNYSNGREIKLTVYKLAPTSLNE